MPNTAAFELPGVTDYSPYNTSTYLPTHLSCHSLNHRNFQEASSDIKDYDFLN